MPRSVSPWLILPGLAIVGLAIWGAYDLVSSAVSPPRPVRTPVAFVAPTPGKPAIHISPTSGRAGTVVTVIGSGFPPGATLSIRIGSARHGVPMMTYATTEAGPDGQFATSIVLPSNWPDGAPIDDKEVRIVASSGNPIISDDPESQSADASVPFGYLPPATPDLASIPPAVWTAVFKASSAAAPAPPAPQPTKEAAPATEEPSPTAAKEPTLASPTTAPSATHTARPSASPTPAPVNAGEVLTPTLHLRAGPGTGFPSLGTLASGSGFTVLGQDATGSWLYILVPGGQTGWIFRGDTNYRAVASFIAPPPLASPSPTSTPTPAASPSITPTPPPTYAEWRGEYYSNSDLGGDPVLVRNDPGLNFMWGSSSPVPGLPSHNYSVRWTRTWTFTAGTYRFHAVVDDGVRVYVDGKIFIDAWTDGSQREDTADTYLTDGKHEIRVEYYQNYGVAVINVWWEQPANPSYPDWKAEYFDNQSLNGIPDLTRNDVDINFNWNGQPPVTGIPGDSFSVRWTRSYSFSSGLYEFVAQTDDGVRLYLDGHPLINEWHGNPGWSAYRARMALSGTHSLQVEYYQAGGRSLAHVWWYTVATPTPARAPK